jgi:GT2 family glycosyltransferase
VNYSFLLVNFNMWGLVERCVRDIRSALRPGETCEVLIADNSTDPRHAAPEDVSSLGPSLRVVRLADNRGWVDALNRLLPEAAGDFIVVMHPDVTPDPGCFATLRGYLEEHPRAAVAAPRLMYPDGSKNSIRLRFPSVAVEARRLVNILCHIAMKVRPLRDEVLWDYASDAQADMVMSVLMVWRREALRQVGLVESRLWTYYANDWLCGRARRLGWTCHYVAAARAVHWERHSPRGLYSDGAGSEYKRDPVPVSDRMCRDRFVFLSEFYSMPVCSAFRVLATAEHLIHLAAQLKPGRSGRGSAIRRHAATIRAAWA